MRALTAALAGATRPVDRHLDGIDISPFLLGHRETSGRDTFFHYAWTYLQVVRQGGWKLVIPRPANPLWTSWYGRLIDAVETPKLYHLAADNSELNNLAAFDSLRVAAAFIVREGQIWMYYKGRSRAHGPAGPTTPRMGVAIAALPTGPLAKHDANPLPKPPASSAKTTSVTTSSPPSRSGASPTPAPATTSTWSASTSSTANSQ